MSYTVLIGTAGSGGLHGAAARAGVFATTPEFAASAQYSTNPQLLGGEAQPGAAAVVNVGLPLDWNDGARQLELAPRARLAEASGTSPIGRDGYYLTGLARADVERGSLAVTAHWVDDSAAIASPASGTLTRLDVAERSTDVGLSWTRTLLERLQSSFGAGWQSQRYGFVPDSGLYDYRYASANETLQAAFSERKTLQLAVAVSRYTAPALDYGQTSQSLQLGVSRQWDEKWTYSLLAGRSQAHSSGSVGQSSGTVYSANLSRKGLESTLLVSLTQSFQPSGFGALTLTREANVRADWNTTERLALYLALRSVSTSDSFASTTFAARTYQSAAAGLTWRASEVWDVALSASYQRQHTDVGAQSGHGTGAVLSANRRFGRLRLG